MRGQSVVWDLPHPLSHLQSVLSHLQSVLSHLQSVLSSFFFFGRWMVRLAAERQPSLPQELQRWGWARQMHL
jgi:hypothetical protein